MNHAGQHIVLLQPRDTARVASRLPPHYPDRVTLGPGGDVLAEIGCHRWSQAGGPGRLRRDGLTHKKLSLRAGLSAFNGKAENIGS